MNDQEINEAVARKLGWTIIDDLVLGKAYGRPSSGIPVYANKPPTSMDYCHSIEAAWEVVEFLAKKNFTLDLSFEIYINPRARVSIRSDGGGGTWHLDVKSIQADTAPMAICLAFLKLEEK